MVTKAIYLNTHYPGLDVKPVKNFYGGGSNTAMGLTYDVLWYNKAADNDHIAVLKEDPHLKHLKPDQTCSLFRNLQIFKDMFDLECSEDYWKSLMRDVVRHNLDNAVLCGDECHNFPLCSTVYDAFTLTPKMFFLLTLDL